MSDSRWARTLEVFEEGVDEGLHFGGQIVVHQRGEVVGDLVLGERRPGEPISSGDLMLWQSSTKPVAAIALAQLWQRGLLALDDTIARHVPEFAAHGKERITLRHALTHTGGFRLLNLGWPRASWEEVLERICQARPEPRWTPGEKAGYHLESSWFVLGEVVRRVDGRPFERYVREEIFEPLGLLDCWVGMPVERYRAYGPRIVPVYDTSDVDAPAPLGWHREERLTRPNPGGGGCGPMGQLAGLYQALLDALQAARQDEDLLFFQLLRPQTVEALTAAHRVGLYDHTFRHVMDWGLGFIRNSEHYYSESQGASTLPYGYGRHASRRTFGHSGRQSSAAFADPEHGLVVAMAVNGAPGDERHTTRFRELTEAIYEDLGLG